MKTPEMIKEAIIGPLIDLNLVGIPSIIGYLKGKKDALKAKKIDKSQLDFGDKLVRHALLPGSLGYWGGYSSGVKQRKNKQGQ